MAFLLIKLWRDDGSHSASGFGLPDKALAELECIFAEPIRADFEMRSRRLASIVRRLESGSEPLHQSRSEMRLEDGQTEKGEE